MPKKSRPDTLSTEASPDTLALAARITELEDQLQDAQGAIARHSDEFRALQSEFDKLESHYDSLEKAHAAAQALADKHEAAAAALEAEVAKLKKQAQATPPAPTWSPLGSVASHTGVLAIGDTFCFDQQWKGNDSQGFIAVDFAGPLAEYLAHRQTDIAPQLLEDGAYRIVCPNVPHARNLQHSAESWLRTQPAEIASANKVTVGSLAGSGLKCRDASRGRGAGIVAEGGSAAFAAAKLGRSGAIPVSGLWEGDKLKAIRIDVG